MQRVKAFQTQEMWLTFLEDPKDTGECPTYCCFRLKMRKESKFLAAIPPVDGPIAIKAMKLVSSST